jgi:hypothetical protein
MQCISVPKAAINCLFTTPQEAVHFVRNIYGDSKVSYRGPVWIIPIHGIGQGNGAGPAIWAVVSMPLLSVLHQKGFGCSFIFLLSSDLFHFVGYAFVDDTDILQPSLRNCQQQTLTLLQQAIDTWENSLKATCGVVVPEKTVWWLVSFKWEGNSWKYALIQDSLGELFINNISDTRKMIKRLGAEQAHKTLGVFIAPDGNLQAQVEKMKRAAIQWVDAM